MLCISVLFSNCSATSLINSCKLKTSRFIVIAPLSRCESISKSCTKASKPSRLLAAFFKNFSRTFRSSIAPSKSVWIKPCAAKMGVLSSCETSARNSLLNCSNRRSSSTSCCFLATYTKSSSPNFLSGFPNLTNCLRGVGLKSLIFRDLIVS